MYVLGVIMAGGRGERLYPLTQHRAKPAVPFGGRYRIIDFVLSNFINSGILSIYVVTQFKAQSLLEHLDRGWRTTDFLGDHFVTPVPAQMRSGEDWYQGTADCVYQNLYLLERHNPRLVAVFGADHIYRMNIASMIEYHEQKRAEITVAAIPVDRKHAAEFGVIETAPGGRIVGFHEKRPDAPTIPGSTEQVYASMGNYVFSTRRLLRELYADAGRENSTHDFGRDILPALVNRVEMYAYNFQDNQIPGEAAGAPAYWRDVGTLDAYYEAQMDLRAVSPSLNLYNGEWPLRTASYADPPAKFTFDDADRRGHAIDSIVSGGCILSGGMVRNSVLGRWVRVHSGALVEDSVILDNCDIGRRAKIQRAILDKNVRIPEGATIGYDLDQDRKYHTVTDSGIVVVEGLRSSVDISSLLI